MADTCSANHKIPVIDFSRYSINIPDAEADKLLLSGEAGVTSLADLLTRALEGDCCAILVNHGIGMSTITSVYDEAKSFFKSPTEYKSQFVSELYGYVPAGLESGESDKLLAPEIESYGARIAPDYKQCPWPDDELPGLRVAFTEWQRVTNRLGGRVLDLLSLGLGFQDLKYLSSTHCELARNASAYRVNYYPAKSEDKECQTGTVRFNEHNDYDTITIVATNGAGLQSRQKDGCWIDVPVIEDSILVQGGSALVEYTSDRILPNHHRVVMPAAPICFKERFTVVAFLAPRVDAVIQSLDSSGKYKSRLAGEYSKDAYEAVFRSKTK